MGLVKHVKGSFHPLLPLPLPTFLTLIPQTEPKNYLHSFFVWPKFRVNNGFDFVEEKKSIKICIIDTIFTLTISPNLPTQQIKFQKKKRITVRWPKKWNRGRPFSWPFQKSSFYSAVAVILFECNSIWKVASLNTFKKHGFWMISKVLLDSSLGPFWNDLLEVLPWSDLREWIIFVFLEKKYKLSGTPSLSWNHNAVIKLIRKIMMKIQSLNQQQP